MTTTNSEFDLALPQEQDKALGPLVHHIKGSVLFEHQWASLLIGAPIMIGALGGCFIASSSRVAATTKVSQFEYRVRRDSKLPPETKKSSKSLQSCLIECSNLGRYAFLEAQKGMARIDSLGEIMSEKIIPGIINCLNEPEGKKGELASRVRTLERASGQCMDVATEIESKFQQWLLYTCSLHVACSEGLSEVARQAQITKIQKEGEEIRERARIENLNTTSEQLSSYRDAVDESNGRLLESFKNFPSGFELWFGDAISAVKKVFDNALGAPKTIFHSITKPSNYSFNANEASNPNWMAGIIDTTSLGDLTIPGTHETMTCAPQLEALFAQCQNHNLETQLQAGIRYIDIRAWVKGDKLVVSHGTIPTGYYLEEVFATVEDFLRRSPRETIIMRIREENPKENSSLSLGDLLVRDYWKSPGKRAFFSEICDRIPNLGEVRGKIVLLQDFTAPERMGLPWGDNNIMSIEDEHDWGIDQIKNKWEAASTQIEHTKTRTAGNHGNTANRLSLVHLNASRIPFLPRMFSSGPPVDGKGVNDHFGRALTTSSSPLNQGSRRWGIIIMDFPGKILIDGIIDAAVKEHHDPNLGQVRPRARNADSENNTGDGFLLDSARQRVQAEREAFELDHDNYAQQVEVVKAAQRELGLVRVQLSRLKSEEINLEVVRDVLIKSIALMIRMKSQLTNLVKFFNSVATMISVVNKTAVTPLIEEMTIALGGNLNNIKDYSLDTFIRTAIFQAVVGISTYFGVFQDIAKMWVQLTKEHFNEGISLAEKAGDSAHYLENGNSQKVKEELHAKAKELDKWVEEAKDAVVSVTTERQNSIQAGLMKRIQDSMKNIPLIMPSRENAKGIREAQAQGQGPQNVVGELTADI
ncbi:hypothetical protein TWF718_003565 [Orbilia javanica]|uniref:Phosphatidylinositol-specific phospholipase C X domain-containing protein n=1 Tax=Orbilia javanica TaxID=47235 RepID=A0AAN8RB70_9PEZI